MADVLVVIGVGGMGEAIVERAGAGKTVLLADVSADAVAGYDHGQVVDVADAASVQALAATAAALGPVVGVAQTAGVSPVQAPSDLVIDVDLLGVAHVLEAFGPVMADGGAGVVISSMSGHMIGPAPADEIALLTTTPAAELNDLACVQEARAGDPGLAYAWAKRATMHLVRAAAGPWGEHGARINSISPGVITTSMGNAELDGPHGDGMRQMVAGSGTGRFGTAEDIAAAAAFLLGPGASFITGTDLLVDGGVVASLFP
jgi:NAD(P)-dependent dehydrogenase (short-subunit alcohol dehydrogenase family)